VANHPSAEKRNRQRIVRTTRNRALKSSVRTLVKKVRVEVTGKNLAAAEKALLIAIAALDSASSKGVYHPKASSRVVGRLSAAVHKLRATAKAA
jgi:small subunit ribosomal protein S20